MKEELATVEQFLRDVVYRKQDDKATEWTEVLGDLKRRAVADDDQATAKLIWCYEQILEIQSNYLAAFNYWTFDK